MADNDSEDWWGTREETVFLQLEVKLLLSKSFCEQVVSWSCGQPLSEV